MSKGRKGERTGKGDPALARQVAALPVRRDGSGRLRILLITSRDTGRWVVPKGWPIDGIDPWHAAAVEALEEAGAEGAVAEAPLGTFAYGKRLSDGGTLPCRVTLYSLRVTRLRKRWKEAHQRRRRWFDPDAAAKRVDEPDLSGILRAIGRDSGRRSALGV